MRTTLLLLGGILSASGVPTSARSEPTIDPSPLEIDLKPLQGEWSAKKVPGKLPGGFQLAFHKSEIVISYFRGGGGAMLQVETIETPFVPKPAGNQLRLCPTKKGAGVSEIVCRVQGNRLVIEEGRCGDGISLKGEWERVPPGLP